MLHSLETVEVRTITTPKLRHVSFVGLLKTEDHLRTVVRTNSLDETKLVKFLSYG